MSQFDKDGEGRVSKAGFVDEPTPSFDTDPNGKLNRDEVAALNNRATQ
jgi:hypothetical protein